MQKGRSITVGSGLGDLNKLVLVDSGIKDYEADTKREIEARQNDPRFKDAIAEATRDFDPKTDEEFDAALRRQLPLYFHDPMSGMPRFAMTDTGPLASAWVMHAFSAADKPPIKEDVLLDRIEAQTLIVVGRSDWICPVAVAERIHKRVRNSRLVVLDKTGHFPWIEDPQQFFAEVTQFAGK